MSVVSTCFDEIENRLSSLYAPPTYKKLVNPTTIELNDSKLLNRGWGFTFGIGTNTNRKIGNRLSIQREFILVNTIIQRGTERDIDIRESAEKQLLEDQYLAIKSFEQNPVVLEGVPKFVYSGDNGMEYVETEKINFIMIRSTFIMEYFDNI